MKKICLLLLIVMTILGTVGCARSKQSIQPLGTNGSDFDGMTIEILSAKRQNGDINLEIQWNNQTEYAVMYGEAFRILQKNGDSWVECKARENTAFSAIGYHLPAGEKVVKAYGLGWIYDLSKPGTYRFETDCRVYDNAYGTECNLWAEFVIEEEISAQAGEISFDTHYIRTDGIIHDGTYPQVLLIDSAEALNAYFRNNDGVYGFSDLEDACKLYNETFFESRFLLMALLGEGSGSIRHEVTQVQVSEGSFNVHISRKVPEAMTCDMAGWHVVIGLDREHLTACEEHLKLLVDGKLAWENAPVQPNISWAEGEYRQPPQLNLIYDGGETPAELGTYSWMFARGDGTWGAVCADSVHPLECEDQLDMIVTAEPLLKLVFQKAPDTVTVQCWPDSRWDSPQAESETISAVDGAISLKEGGYIYEVVATWQENGANCHGTAHYYFYAAWAIPHAHMPISGEDIPEPSGYCGNTQTTLYIGGEALSFEGTNSILITDLLRNLDYREGQRCRCMAEYKVQTEFGAYELNITEGFARNEEGQTELSKEQIALLKPVIDWALEKTKAR